MSDRSFITACYYKENEDGSFFFGHSSTPCDDLHVKHAKAVKGFERAETEFGFHAAPHANGGCKLRFKSFADPKGNVPNAMKQKMAEKQMNFL